MYKLLPISLLALSLSSIGSVSAQTWQEEASMPGNGRHHPVMFSLNNK